MNLKWFTCTQGFGSDISYSADPDHSDTDPAENTFNLSQRGNICYASDDRIPGWIRETLTCRIRMDLYKGK